MDKIDRQILRIIQEDATMAVAEIASQVGLSATPCWRRIQKLRSSGVIERTVSVLNPDAIGLGLTVFVSIEAVDHSPDWLDHFVSSSSAMSEVMDIYRMAGDVDYLLRVVVADMAHFDAFYRTLAAVVPMKTVTSRFAMERVKQSTAYPVP